MSEESDRLVRRVAIVDDEKNIRRMLSMVLEGEGYTVEGLGSAEELLARLEQARFDAVLLDVRLPGMDGLQALEKLKQTHADLQVIMISGHASLNDAVRATKLGAFDFLEKPLDRERVLVSVRNSAERRAMTAKITALEAAGGADEEMLGDSEVMNAVRKQIQKVATTGVRVLITGESGTGKELIARAIHRASRRAAGPFVKVNCAAIPAELIESELFGHEKGSFTGAVARKRGHFEIADGGTLFLDEIGDMSIDAQAKVLRALQTGEIIRVGGEKTFTVDVRVVAATNKNLKEAVDSGGFREDLFYRLSVVPIHSPPLRERGGDVMTLMKAYLDRFAREHGLRPKGLGPEVEAALAAYSFPGNVRELRNLAERLTILGSDPITLEDLPPPIGGEHAKARPPTVSGQITVGGYGSGLTLRELRDRVERDYILKTLEETHWNITRAADVLGIERTNLHKKMKILGLRKDSATGPVEPV